MLKGSENSVQAPPSCRAGSVVSESEAESYLL